MSFLEPNVVLPLACSYNERGVAGFTNTITNAIDQRKVNSFYAPVQNAITGRTTLYLVKRPGVTYTGSDTHGTTGQVAYLISLAPGNLAIGSAPWVFSTSGDDVRASSIAATTVIVTSAGAHPAYVDRTEVSGTDTVVIGVRISSTVYQWYRSTAIATFTQISDGDFTALTHRGKMEFLDGYALIMDSLNRVYNSDLNSLANWTAGSYITKQIKQDSPQGLARLGQQVIAFGAETMEVFYNAGNASGSPLSRLPQLAQRIGLVDPNGTGITHYSATLNNRLYFVGRRAGGLYSVGVFAYDGARCEKVSSPYIDKIIGSNSAARYYSVNSVGFNGQQAIAIALDPTTAATQRWLMFFPDYNEWFEWHSTIFTPVNNSEFFLGVGANQHKVYNFTNSDNWQDDGTNYTFTHQFKMPKKGNEQHTMPMFGLVGDTARSALNVDVQFSRDDWQTKETARTIDMTSKAKMLTRCGAFQDLGVTLSYAGSLEVRLEKAVARVQ